MKSIFLSAIFFLDSSFRANASPGLFLVETEDNNQDVTANDHSQYYQCPAGLKEDALGPFFIPNTLLPLFGDIAPPNEVDLLVKGFVYDSSCRPVPGAKVEVWHAS